MSDRFVDDLYNRLHAERETTVTAAADATQRQQRFETAKQIWWSEFVDVLGQKIGAWNEKGVSGSPVNFTKRPGGAAHVWHKHAEAELTLDGNHVTANARFGSELMKGTVMELHDNDGAVLAKSEDKPVGSPTAAAEKVLTPIFTKVFEG